MKHEELIPLGAKEYGMVIALDDFDWDRDHDTLKSMAKTSVEKSGAQMIEETFEINVPDDQQALQQQHGFQEHVTILYWKALGWPKTEE